MSNTYNQNLQEMMHAAARPALLAQIQFGWNACLLVRLAVKLSQHARQVSDLVPGAARSWRKMSQGCTHLHSAKLAELHHQVRFPAQAAASRILHQREAAARAAGVVIAARAPQQQ